jgi:hypothetical protein
MFERNATRRDAATTEITERSVDRCGSKRAAGVQGLDA